MSYYGLNSLSYTPYYSSSNSYSPFSGYSRALTGGYIAPTRSAYSSSNYNRHYKPKLKPISETPFHTAIRSQALTALTRINSPKSVIVPPVSKYVPPRPILINTANIDVSSNRFDRGRSNRGRSESPELVTEKVNEYVEASNQPAAISNAKADEAIVAATNADAFMPRVDQHDPPQFRSTIRRNRNIVRLSTNRLRSKSNSRNDSIKRNSTHSNSSDDNKPKKVKEATVTEAKPPIGEVKTSWRDRFGDSLVMSQKVVRKTPGELILEKHIIRDKRKDDRFGTTAPPPSPREPFQMPEIIIPSELTHTDAQRRKSIRRQSLAKCPSFKDICKDISADITKYDDLNAGELRRRASLILEQEQQILAQLSNSRRPSAELVNVDAPIIEADEEADTQQKQLQHQLLLQQQHQQQQELQQQLQDHLITKRKSKKKSVKKKPQFTVSVDVDNDIVPLLGTSDSIELPTPTSPKSPSWRAIVEDGDVEHTENKVIKLPKKKTKAVECSTVTNEKMNKLKKSESGEDFWGAIGRRESFYFQKAKQHLAVIDEPVCLPTAEQSQHNDNDKSLNENQSHAINNDISERQSNRKNSLIIVKSNSENDLPCSVKTKLKPPKKKLDGTGTVDEKKTQPRKLLPNKLPILYEVQANDPIKPIVKPKMKLKALTAVLTQHKETDSMTVEAEESTICIASPPESSETSVLSATSIATAASTASSSTTTKDSDIAKTICSVTTSSVASSDVSTTSAAAVIMDQSHEKPKACAEPAMRINALKIATGPSAKSPEQMRESIELEAGGSASSPAAVLKTQGRSTAVSTTPLKADANKEEANVKTTSSHGKLTALSTLRASDNSTDDSTEISVERAATTVATTTSMTTTTTRTTTMTTTMTTTIKKKSNATKCDATKVKTTTTEVTTTATTSAQHKVQGEVENTAVLAAAQSIQAANDVDNVAETVAKSKAAAATTTTSISSTSTTATVIAAQQLCANDRELEKSTAAPTVTSRADDVAIANGNNNNNNINIDRSNGKREPEIYALSKFPTVNNLSNDLSFSDNKPTEIVIDDNESCISGEESFDLLLSSESDEDFTDSEYSDSGDGNDEMGLKRRHRKKKDKFDPKRMVKLDHTRKCYVVEETPKYPLIATPRPLQKKYHYYSESETESEGNDSENSCDEYEYEEYLSPNDGIIKDVIRMSTCSNDSGFEGGGTAPASPKKMLGKHY